MSEQNPFISEDYLEVARSRVTEQFKDKDVFDRYLQLIISAQVELQDVFKDLMQLRSVDTATGAQLDLIGRIVGQDRILLSADLYNFFGFQGAFKAGSFGEIDNPILGALFHNLGDPLGGNIRLDDNTYRLFIKAKIYKNTTSSTPEEFISVINLIFGTSQTQLQETGNANAIVLFSRTLSDFERALLDYISTDSGYPSRLIPKTVGVGIGYGEYNVNNFFGFEGVPGARGFGDLNPDISGTFGYGLGWGMEFGDSDYGLGTPIWFPSYDGVSFSYDGSGVYDSTPTYPGSTVIGGTFATLY